MSVIERTALLFGGQNSERLVSVASAQNLCRHLPEASLWFWSPDGTVLALSAEQLLAHDRPFELDLPTSGATLVAPDIDAAIAHAVAEDTALLLGLHGGPGEDGTLAARCEAAGVPFTGSGSAAARLAFDKIAAKRVAAEAGVRVLETIELPTGSHDRAWVVAALARLGRLVTKPVADGFSDGLMFVASAADIDEVLRRCATRRYIIEPFAAGIEATVGVIDAPGPVARLNRSRSVFRTTPFSTTPASTSTCAPANSARPRSIAPQWSPCAMLPSACTLRSA
jgi:D-alanine-D-alanine ligase